MEYSWKGFSGRNIRIITLMVFILLTLTNANSQPKVANPSTPSEVQVQCTQVRIIGTFGMNKTIASVTVWEGTEAVKKFTFQAAEAKRLAPGATNWLEKNVSAELKRSQIDADQWTLIYLGREPKRLNRYTQEALRCLDPSKS